MITVSNKTVLMFATFVKYGCFWGSGGRWHALHHVFNSPTSWLSINIRNMWLHSVVIEIITLHWVYVMRTVLLLVYTICRKGI